MGLAATWRTHFSSLTVVKEALPNGRRENISSAEYCAFGRQSITPATGGEKTKTIENEFYDCMKKMLEGQEEDVLEIPDESGIDIDIDYSHSV